MPFIGQNPSVGAYNVLDDITISSNTNGPFNLLLNGAAFSPESANHLLVSLNGVIQKPGSSFTISGSQITFVPSSGTLTTSDSIDFVMALGNVLDIGVPTDGSVSDAKIASGISASKLTTGTLPTARLNNTLDLSSNTVTLNKNASSLVHLARIDATPSATQYEWSMNYTDYTHFKIIVERITGSAAGTTENLDVNFKFDGTLDNGNATPYNQDINVIGAGTQDGSNNQAHMEWMYSNSPSYRWTGVVDCLNFGPNDAYAHTVSLLTGHLSNGQQAYFSSTGTDQANDKRITDIRIGFTSGNVNIVKLDIYGVKS